MGKRKPKRVVEISDEDDKLPLSKLFDKTPISRGRKGEVLAELPEDNSKHRTCWRHLASFQANAGNLDIKEIKKRFEWTSPCFSKSVPCHRKRSLRRTQGRDLSRQRGKMNDFTFDDHLENIWRSLSDDKKSSFAQVGSFCFSLYQREQSKGLNLIKKEDIFSKKYVFVPIVCWDHWRLVIFCHFGEDTNSETGTRCILLLDSAEMGARIIEPDIRKFVFDIFKAEGRPEIKDAIYRIPLLVPKVPQQKNEVDCGRFVLYFIKQFIDAAPDNFSISNGYTYFMEPEWFTPEKFQDFCDKLDSESSASQKRQRVLTRCSQRVKHTRGLSRKTSKKDNEVISID